VPGDATAKDVEAAITLPYDKPRHVESGFISYVACDAEVSVEVRSRLEKHGPLENFYLAPTSKGKRVKATAWFEEEADARMACSLNNMPLCILNGGKLTVTLVQSAKSKVSTSVYFASKSRIDRENKTWEKQHLAFRVYPDTSRWFITLKVEGDNAKDVANARKSLDEILGGVVLMDGNGVVWDAALSNNGSAYKKLKLIEKELNIVIVRHKSKRQLKFHGPPEKFQQAADQITDMLKTECSRRHEIILDHPKFYWTIRGGFKSIEQALGKNIAVFNVISKSIIISGTEQQYETALAVMDGKRVVKPRSLPDGLLESEEDCPICFCEADNPIQTSCKHTYCLGCFEEYCTSSASTTTDEFQIKCQGDGGNCSTVFTLDELKDHLSSSVFETVLKSSFEGYIRRRPEALHYCPTLDCGYVYRRTTASGSKPPVYTCPNCLKPLCTSCHARHDDYTCAEYQDSALGDRIALERLKAELNIKDCPKCATPIEKTEGCNHMTCLACSAHICWVCMAVFSTGYACYSHLYTDHGGLGPGFEHLMVGGFGQVVGLGWIE